MKGIIVDLFAGGGGASTGIEAALGRFAPAYDLSRAKTKAAKVRLIGNSVCPEVAEAIIRANFEVAEELAA